MSQMYFHNYAYVKAKYSVYYIKMEGAGSYDSHSFETPSWFFAHISIVGITLVFFFQSYMLPAFFGGVSLTDYDTVTKVSAVTTSYFLDVSEDWRAMLGDRWEKQLLEDVQNKAQTFCPDLEVSMFVSNTPAWEMERLGLLVML